MLEDFGVKGSLGLKDLGLKGSEEEEF